MPMSKEQKLKLFRGDGILPAKTGRGCSKIVASLWKQLTAPKRKTRRWRYLVSLVLRR